MDACHWSGLLKYQKTKQSEKDMTRPKYADLYYMMPSLMAAHTVGQSGFTIATIVRRWFAIMARKLLPVQVAVTQADYNRWSRLNFLVEDINN